MSSQARNYTWSALGAVALACIWLMVRLFWITELFGNATPSFEEILAALIAGFILGGLILAVHETRKNERNHGAALAELCKTMGFTFSVPASQAELGPLADSPLLRRYTAFLSRMSGLVQGHPVELLDASRWVERRDDGGTSRFEWRHTVVVFPAPTDLPTFILHPVGMVDRYISEFAGAKGVTFVHGIDSVDQVVQQQFQSQYLVWPGDKPFFASLDEPCATETAELGAVFSAEVVKFFAEHPGWCVQITDGQVAMWREDRIVEPTARPALLAAAAAVYQILAEAPRAQDPALHISLEKPLDLSHASNTMIVLFVGCGIGLFLGFVVSGFVMYLCVSMIPNPPSWFIMIVFPVLVLGGMLLGAYAGCRIACRLFRGPG